MDQQSARRHWERRLWEGRKQQWPHAIGGLALSVALSGCQNSSNPSKAELTQVAQFYVDNGGLSLGGKPKRPCLRGLDLKNTVLGGLFGGSVAVVDFIEQQKLATVTRTPDGTGRTQVSMSPTAEAKEHWIVNSGTDFYCFGRFAVLKVEPVADAKPVTAGANEPWLIPGTEARATRITYKWDEVPEPLMTALKDRPNVLVPGSLQPDDYGQEHTVVALLPAEIENFAVNP